MRNKNYSCNGIIRTIAIAKRIAKEFNLPVIKVKKILDTEHSLTKEFITSGYQVNYEGFITFDPYVRCGYTAKNMKNEKINLSDEMFFSIKKSKNFTYILRKQPISLKYVGEDGDE